MAPAVQTRVRPSPQHAATLSLAHLQTTHLQTTHLQTRSRVTQPIIPEGFQFASIDAGLAKGERPDLWLAVADEASPATAVFTTNAIVASPVAMSREHLRQSNGQVRAILVNAGCANACTGAKGDEDAARIAERVAETLDCPVQQILLFSTGVIGKRLRVDAIESALPRLFDELTNDPEAISPASRAILTTDLVPKVAHRRVHLEGGAEAEILGLAKGSGMIAPNMATMLGFVFSDLDFGASASIQLRAAVQESFHRIDVDGDTSTNDSVLLWHSAKRREPPADGASDGLTCLTEVSVDLAKSIARDGEGATRLIEVEVRAAATPDQAERCARTVASSMLVRTAVHGGDPNWGRIVAAVGRSGVDLDTRKLRIGIGAHCLFEDDMPHPEREPDAAVAIREDPVHIWVDLARGQCDARFWTCDLSADYIRINADYRS